MYKYNECLIYDKLLELYRFKQRAVKTGTIAGFVPYTDRYIRLTLAALEQRGIVRRQSPRGGWLPVPA